MNAESLRHIQAPAAPTPAPLRQAPLSGGSAKIMKRSKAVTFGV